MNIGNVDIKIKHDFERFILSLIINLILGCAVVVGLNALGIYLFYSIILAIIVFIIGTIFLAKRLPTTLIGLFKAKPFICSLWLLFALVGIIQTARLSIFMINPTKTQYSLFPNDKWFVEHCCLTAYTEAVMMSHAGEKNIYDKNLYLVKNGGKDESGFLVFRKILQFKLDQYHYPPTFLLLPTSIISITGENFLNIRMLWFSLGIIMLMIAIGLIIYRLESEGRMRMFLMLPLLWCSLPLLAGLQMSNVQVIVVSISIISMLLFPIQKAVGGILLAMSTVAKIFPGILGVYLLIQKKYREAAWTVGFAVLLSILAFLIFGSAPFVAFFTYEIPILSSGEAFTGPFSRAFAVAKNMAPFGIPLKLNWPNIDIMTLTIGRLTSIVFLIIIAFLAIWSGKQKPRSNTEAISIWISLLSLGSLVSPFAPSDYVLLTVTLLICMNHELISIKMALIFLLFINAPLYISRQAPFLIQVFSFLPAQAIILIIPGYVLYKAGLKTNKEIMIK